MVVLVPLVFLTGVPGIFFKALALTLSLAIMASMLLAVFLTPAVAVTFISTKKRKPGKVISKIINAHQKALNFGLKRPVTAYLLIAITIFAGIYLFKRIPSGFLPQWDEGTIVLDYITPPGSSVDRTPDDAKNHYRLSAFYSGGRRLFVAYRLKFGSFANPRQRW